jgi:predicted  nucleic acid-binding Zn-ribbon protein
MACIVLWCKNPIARLKRDLENCKAKIAIAKTYKNPGWKEIVAHNQGHTEKLQALKFQIKTLEQKKPTLTDADEIKAVNKEINALQEEFGRLREEMKNERAFLKDIERGFVHCVVGDE